MDAKGWANVLNEVVTKEPVGSPWNTITNISLDAQNMEIDIQCTNDVLGNALLALSIGPRSKIERPVAELTPEEARALIRALNCVLAGVSNG